MNHLKGGVDALGMAGYATGHPIMQQGMAGPFRYVTGQKFSIHVEHIIHPTGVSTGTIMLNVISSLMASNDCLILHQLFLRLRIVAAEFGVYLSRNTCCSLSGS